MSISKRKISSVVSGAVFRGVTIAFIFSPTNRCRVFTANKKPRKYPAGLRAADSDDSDAALTVSGRHGCNCCVLFCLHFPVIC
jgi:hypothetical protein